jgi:hypothetical protein
VRGVLKPCSRSKWRRDVTTLGVTRQVGRGASDEMSAPDRTVGTGAMAGIGKR